ncbi:hypothetical protein C2S51_038014 [Perilla frutescens var. frutescens]|nr:hypothetical protein C2S51_038014 [Perilla frutescens var. frutescens]
MGGIMKGAHGHMHAAYSYSRRRWANMYVVMVIVCSVFGCGILGLMGLHRLRERRSLNLLLKDKDDQILSLHLLLQKEREHVVQVKRKTEELKMKIMNLGSQKAELNSRISDMQSTISSLREEQRTVELAFEEKQNEEKLLRDEYLQVKEAEIEDLKNRLQLHGAEVGTVSANATATSEANTTMFHENEGGDVQDEERKHVADASRDGETESSMSSKEEIDGSSGNGGTRASEEDGTKYGSDQEREGRETKEYENGKIGGLGHQVQQLPRRSKPQSSDNQQVEVHGGRMEMEMQENPHRFRGKRGYLRRAKGKRWRSIAKQTEGKRASLSNAASTMVDEDRPPGKDSKDLSSNNLRNSSSEKTRVSLEELAKQSEIKMEDSGSSNKDGEDNQQSEEQISVVKPTEDRHEHQHTDLLGRKQAAERNEEEADGVQKRDSEEIGIYRMVELLIVRMSQFTYYNSQFHSNPYCLEMTVCCRFH